MVCQLSLQVLTCRVQQLVSRGFAIYLFLLKQLKHNKLQATKKNPPFDLRVWMTKKIYPTNTPELFHIFRYFFRQDHKEDVKETYFKTSFKCYSGHELWKTVVFANMYNNNSSSEPFLFIHVIDNQKKCLSLKSQCVV